MTNISILNASVREMALIEELSKVAIEAIQASEIIFKAYSNAFGLGKNQIHVYHFERFGEYEGDAELSIDGTWHYHDNWGGGDNWYITSSDEGIYKCYRAELLKKHGLEKMLNLEERKLANVAFYFRDFVAKAKEKIS